MSARLLVKLTALAFVGAASIVSIPAHAAAVTATSSFLDLTTSLLDLSNHQYLSDASTPFDSGFDTGSVLTDYYFNTSTASGTSFAQIDGSLAPLPQTSAGAILNGEGHASVLWTFDWTATASGTASISLDYLFNATIANLLPGETGFARAYASLLLDGTSLGDSALYFFNSTQDDVSGFSQLGLSFAVTAGQIGTFTLALASDALAAPAPVPLPAALPLFGAGLLSLAGFARRRRSLKA